MKKLIATALSIVLGTFGYVIVDKTIEDRVSELEKQVSSLQMYHTTYEETLSSNENEDSTSTDVSYEQTTKPIITVGSIKEWDSTPKFLIRLYDDETIYAYDQKTLNAIEESTMIDENAHKKIVAEYYLQITSAYSKVDEIIENETTTRVEYDENLSTTVYTESYNPEYIFSVVISGYTDRALAGRKIDKFYCAHNSTFHLLGEAVINEEGMFEFVSVGQQGYFERTCKINSLRIK